LDLLAIMGRGIQMLKPDSDPTKVVSYALTEDLELCDERSAHLAVRVPADDANPYCMVGGGQMNLDAGVQLIDDADEDPSIVVCAYGDRSDYLKSVNGPSESEVMSAALAEIFRHRMPPSPTHLNPEIVVWPRARSLPIPSNTGQEIKNIFALALERNCLNVGIVTIGVHIPRTATYVAKQLSREPGLRNRLSVQLFESEEVLVAANPANWPRVEALRNSQAFARNWGGKNREADGISKIVRDVYGDAKPKVETK
jgi:hypothetical protein